MPRASSAAKRQQGAANQRDTRHENGLVDPAKSKSVRKQKSNGHLNGHAKLSDNPPPTPPLPLPETNGHARQPPSADLITDSKIQVESSRRTSVGDYSESSFSDSYHNPHLMSASHENCRAIDANATKNPAVHRDTGAIHLAVTILRSMPLTDTIAILIVLLQLPPTILSVIHVLFSCLTFVPSSSNGESILGGFFDGSLGNNTPSLATMLVVDTIIMLMWAFLWAPIRKFSLDLAQSVIALTLGGATSGKEIGIKNVFVCFGIVLYNHLTRKKSKSLGLGASLSSLTNGYLGSSDSDDPLENTSIDEEQGNHWVNTLRKLVAIHILIQGGVRYIRAWYVRRENRGTSSSIGDPEAANIFAESSSESQGPHIADGESSTTLPVSHLATVKKRRKISQRTRIQQPLWAALASTKIVMVKEYERESAAAESAGTNATDANNLGNAPFDKESDKVWITYIGHDSIVFATSYFPSHTPSQTSDESYPDSAAIDLSKPFYVKVNSSTWQPTRIYADNSQDDNAEQPGSGHTRWEGEIPGLTPMSSYQCDFISTVDGSLIFSTCVTTLAPKVDVQSGVAPKPTMGGRPGSANTTLKSSIAASEQKLTEEKAKQKRDRKDHRAKLNSIRKDIEKLNASIASSGGNDDKQRQKIQQSKTHMKQAEDDLAAVELEIQALSTSPIVDDSEYKTSRQAYKSEKERHRNLQSEFQEFKRVNDTELQALVAEVTSLQQKRDKMQSRITKLDGELVRMKDANAKGLSEAQRIASERDAKLAERAYMEQMLQTRLFEINQQIESISPQLLNLSREVQSMLLRNELMGSPSASVSNLAYNGIPEGSVPAAPNYPWNPNPSPAAAYAAPHYVPTVMHSPMNQSPYRRGRSSSMLSNVSGFTQCSDDMMQQNMYSYWAGNVERKDSSGSGSISGSGSAGSVGDPKSPIPSVPKSGRGAWDDK
ncbi:hypothetical protein B0O99DRAFT_651931 [Bisporella sp. PMI_857]|nr:hypothetical protein B0O99DRAFT_651931 [Bisporella sp. PMI_857]